MARVLDILVLNTTDDSGPLAGLSRLDVRTQNWNGSREALVDPACDAVLIVSDDHEALAAAVSTLRESEARNIPRLAISDGDSVPEGVDAWLRPPAATTQIASRLRALVRLRVMEDIVRRRRAAAEVFGHDQFEISDEKGKPTVLFVGEASSRFLDLRHALAGADADVVAAFSSYSAFDYLHERAFDAVVLNATTRQEMAFTISSAMRRNARLYHTPVLLLSRGSRHDDADEAFARGVSDILPWDADEMEIRERVLRLASERQRRRVARARLDACRAAKTLDAETGLFRARFGIAHLQDLVNAGTKAHRPTGLVVMRLSAPAEAQSDAAVRSARIQFASMLRHLLRAEDCPVAMSPDVFAAILPSTHVDGADSVAERIRAIAECTAFEGDDPLKAFRLTVQTGTAEARGAETAETLIERTQRQIGLPRTKAV
ncbi:MAG: hypothetical protein CMF74_04415 [Maricaulis sp.]|nr:hypothetical protein [Maricaulis sp.]